ncbi:MAG: FGGY-family carbohydrate kinase [Sedimentitalea sp.]
MRFTLGVDIGTYETKGVLVDEAGSIVAQSARAHDMIVPQAGWAEHRADEDWWGDFVYVTQALLEQSGVDPGDIACVATSAIGPCLLAVDGEGKPLMNGILYGVDTRASAQIAQLNEQIGEDVVFERCGNALTSQSIGPKILWLKEQRPEIFAQAKWLMGSTSFLVMKLTNEVVIDHYTAANFSPFYDVQTQDWSDELAPDVLDLARLPRLMWSNEIAGKITDKAAQETGLAVGTPVTCGTIDAAAEAISVGVTQTGDTMMMYGSTIFMIMLTESRLSDARLWYAPWVFEGQHAAMAGLATSGTLTHWFRDQFARELSRAEAFGALAQEAAASPTGANGLLMLPYFSGERTPLHDPLAKGAFFGLNLTHTRGDMYRALLEGIAFGTRHVVDCFAEAGQKPKNLLAVGGGLRNEVWMKATSDICGLTQIMREKTVGASFGNAFLAACAVGLAKPDEITDWNPLGQKMHANTQDVYEETFRHFVALYRQTQDIAHAL